jgi:hypothetical protein
MGRETYETQVTIVTEFCYVTGAVEHEAVLQLSHWNSDRLFCTIKYIHLRLNIYIELLYITLYACIMLVDNKIIASIFVS